MPFSWCTVPVLRLDRSARPKIDRLLTPLGNILSTLTTSTKAASRPGTWTRGRTKALGLGRAERVRAGSSLLLLARLSESCLDESSGTRRRRCCPTGRRVSLSDPTRRRNRRLHSMVRSDIPVLCVLSALSQRYRDQYSRAFCAWKQRSQMERSTANWGTPLSATAPQLLDTEVVAARFTARQEGTEKWTYASL